MNQSSADNRHLPPPDFFALYFPHGLRLLLVGTDETIIEREFGHPRYQIVKCFTGASALDLLLQADDRFHLVISDVSLPDMDGFLFIRDQRLSTDIAHVVICGAERSSDIVTAYRSGACYVFCKPLMTAGELRNIWELVYMEDLDDFVS